MARFHLKKNKFIEEYLRLGFPILPQIIYNYTGEIQHSQFSL
jgi:hypothetical protein